MSSTKRADRKARRIANRNAKVKTRNVSVTVEVELTDGTTRTVKTPLVGQFIVTDNDGTRRLFERRGSYQRTVRSALAAIKVGERRVRTARIVDPKVAV